MNFISILNIKRLALLGTLSVTALSSGGAFAQTSINKEEAYKLVTPLYSMFNQPATKDLKALADIALIPQWKSYSSQTEFKSREEFLGQIAYFGKIIPDLKWEIKELFIDGNRIIVIGEGSGTPVGPIFGVPVSGKSFKIMAIDVHTFKEGKLIEVFHVEDWAGAIKQLTAK
jgi:predicted ester cyclase